MPACKSSRTSCKTSVNQVLGQSFLQNRVHYESPYGIVCFLHVSLQMQSHSDIRKGRMQGNLSAGSTSPSTLVRGLTQVSARVIDRLSMSKWPVEFAPGSIL